MNLVTSSYECTVLSNVKMANTLMHFRNDNEFCLESGQLLSCFEFSMWYIQYDVVFDDVYIYSVLWLQLGDFYAEIKWEFHSWGKIYL